MSPKPKPKPQPDAEQPPPPRRSNAFRAASSSASSLLEPDGEQPAPPRRSNALHFQTASSSASSSNSSLEPIGTREGEWFAECDLGKAPARARSSTSTAADGGGGGDGGGGDSAGQPRPANADERPYTVYLEPVIADVSPRELAEALDIDVVQLQWTVPVAAAVGPPTSPRAGLAMTHRCSAGPTVTGQPSPRRSRPLEPVDESDAVVCSPKIGRRQAEAQLAAAGGKPGTFLFRQGSSGGTVLTVSDGDLVRSVHVPSPPNVPPHTHCTIPVTPTHHAPSYHTQFKQPLAAPAYHPTTRPLRGRGRGPQNKQTTPGVATAQHQPAARRCQAHPPRTLSARAAVCPQVHHLVVNDKQGVPVTSFDTRQWMAFVGHYKDAKGALPTTLRRLVLG